MKDKEFFYQDDIPHRERIPPNYPEFSCKTLMKDGYLSSKDQARYLPSTDPKKVDRQFVWDLFKYLKPIMSEKYYVTSLDLRYGTRVPEIKVNKIMIDDSLLDSLL